MFVPRLSLLLHCIACYPFVHAGRPLINKQLPSITYWKKQCQRHWQFVFAKIKHLAQHTLPIHTKLLVELAHYAQCSAAPLHVPPSLPCLDSPTLVGRKRCGALLCLLRPQCGTLCALPPFFRNAARVAMTRLLLRILRRVRRLRWEVMASRVLLVAFHVM